ncbi:MAG: hypothetical protein LBJ12_04120 [Oscillospiraceae bacterium]|nr:hypothetical protein [Oscillospiraceae bacterium]
MSVLFSAGLHATLIVHSAAPVVFICPPAAPIFLIGVEKENAAKLVRRIYY